MKHKHLQGIFKVQRPIASNDPNAGYLIYNEDRSIWFQMDPTDVEVKLMGTKYKVFIEYNNGVPIKTVKDPGW